MKSRVWLNALSAQAGGVMLAYLMARTSASLGTNLQLEAVIAIQAMAAVMMSVVLRLPRWWLPLQALFLPTLAFTLNLNLPPPLFLAGFTVLWLIFRHNTRERVPLYLSNPTTWRALVECLPDGVGVRFVDLGCGLGGTLAYLADARSDGHFYGIESAPLPFLLSRLRLMRKDNAEVCFGDIWCEHLGKYDVVYVFLSPEPMPALWEKARAEMRPGSLLISNSFEIPGIPATETLCLHDARQTRLLMWRL